MSDKRKNSNLLDFVPVVIQGLHHETDSTGKVTIFRENKGVFHSIAQKLLKKPRFSQIHLDEMGSFIWTQINGSNDIYAIGKLVKGEFGEKAEPLYDRLIQYIKTLEQYGFIKLNNKSER